MRTNFSILLVLTVLSVQAAEHKAEPATGREYFAATEYGKAANRFKAECNAYGHADACYWAGLSYERLADVQTPFGCRADAKARRYLSKAIELAPGMAPYRDAMFDLLLNSADCSRSALREAAAMLAATPESDPRYNMMRARLELETSFKGSLEGRLAQVFLAVPRAAYSVATVRPDVAGNHGAVNQHVGSETAPAKEWNRETKRYREF